MKIANVSVNEKSLPKREVLFEMAQKAVFNPNLDLINKQIDDSGLYSKNNNKRRKSGSKNAEIHGRPDNNKQS